MKYTLSFLLIYSGIGSFGQTNFGIEDCLWNKNTFESLFLPYTLDSNIIGSNSLNGPYRRSGFDYIIHHNDSTNLLSDIEIIRIKRGRERKKLLISFLSNNNAQVKIIHSTIGLSHSFWSNRRKKKFKKIVDELNKTFQCD